jgi:hypothetical protein
MRLFADAATNPVQQHDAASKLSQYVSQMRRYGK